MAKSSESNVSVKKKSAGSTVVWGVVILVMMGLGGYGTVQFSGNLRSVGKVGETDIPVGRYQQQLSSDILAIQQQIGLRLSMEQAKSFGLDRAALAKVVNQIAVENEARRIELGSGDAAVAEYLMSQSQFFDFSGNFDQQTYRATLRSMGYSVGSYEDEIRSVIGRNLLQASLATGVAMPPAMAEFLYQWSAERRSFNWVELTEADLKTPVAAPTEADLTAWHNDHPDLYTDPEKRRLTYVWITPDMLVATIEVSDADLQALYDSRKADYIRPERRLVERVVLGSQEEAEATMARLSSGELDFETLVSSRGLTLDDVNLDEVTEADLGPAGAIVFASAEPGVVGPAETSLGPAIFRINAILDAEETSFDEVKESLRQEVALDRARRQIDGMFEEVNDLLAGGASLEDLAGETLMELGTIDWTPDSKDGIAAYDAFRTAALGAEKDDFAEAKGLDNGGIFSLRLDEVIAPQVKPLDQVRDKVAEDWRRDAVLTALNALADSLLPQIEAGASPGSLGLSANQFVELTRDAAPADVPAGLVAKAFELAPGKAARIAGTDGTSTVAIVRTTEVLPADEANSEMLAARDAYAARMTQQLQADLVAAYSAAISGAAGIRVDEAAVEAVNAVMN